MSSSSNSSSSFSTTLDKLEGTIREEEVSEKILSIKKEVGMDCIISSSLQHKISCVGIQICFLTIEVHCPSSSWVIELISEDLKWCTFGCCSLSLGSLTKSKNSIPKSVFFHHLFSKIRKSDILCK